MAIPGTSRCAQHTNAYDATTRRSNAALRMAQTIRTSTAWRTLRKSVMSRNPVCCDPFGEHTLGPEPAKDVHHVFPLITHPHLALVEDNLRPLCRSCHNRIEAMERRGEPTQELFNHAQTTQTPA